MASIKEMEAMLCVKDNITGAIYHVEKFDLRDLLESIFALDEDGVISAIDAVCADPFDPINYWAEDYLNICVERGE